MTNEASIQETLKHCSQETIDACIAFHEKGDSSLVPAIVFGIIERFLDSDGREILSDRNNSTKLGEDLGMDSLDLIEVVMTIEQALQIKVENESLKSFLTIGDIKSFIENYER